MAIKYLRNSLILIILLSIWSCKRDQQNNGEMDQYSYELGVIAGFSEMINAGVKQLALSAPMTPDEMDEFMEKASNVASRHNVSVFRESDLIITDLFPSDVAVNKDVLLLYRWIRESDHHPTFAMPALIYRYEYPCRLQYWFLQHSSH